MLYVVVREIEGGPHRDDTVFSVMHEARQYYITARLVCDNDPDEFGNGDPAIVSCCWLYAVDTRDPEVARVMARDGRAILVASYANAEMGERRRKIVTTRKR